MNITKMTFGEYKANGGEYDYKVFANDCGSFGKAGSTIYGQPAGIDDWVIDKICADGDLLNGQMVVTLHIICPFGE